VLELAPGLGRTARSILARHPRSYVGVESDDSAVELTRQAVGDAGELIRGEASRTGLPDASVDAVIGEAMLTMQTDAHKAEIVAEAFRVLRPNGRYAIHELALTPDSVDDSIKNEIRSALARSIKVNARPLTAAEWTNQLTAAGFTVQTTSFAPMALLEPRRLIADEGLARTLRFVANVLRDTDARARVRGMRSTFRKHRQILAAVSVIAVKPR